MVVQTDPASQCGLVRTPLGIVPEPEQCTGCYSILFTGWGAPNVNNTTPTPDDIRSATGPVEARTEIRGHALPRDHCPSGDERCEVYQGFKPVCAALIRDRRAVSSSVASSSSAANSRPRPIKNDDSNDDDSDKLATSVPCEPSVIPHSNRSLSTAACTGVLGTECAFTCDTGYLKGGGRHVCQSYRILDRKAAPLVVFNHTFFGGRCDRLCSPYTCQPNEVAVRHNSTDDAGPCLATLCEPSADAALRRLARGNYELWRRARNPSTGVYAGSVSLSNAALGRLTPAITDVTGIGMIMECVAHAMEWQNRSAAQQRVKQTLSALAGDLPGFTIPRNKDGWLPTFFDQDTGVVAMMGADQFSLMSSGLNAVSVLFVAQYWERTDPGSTATARISALARQLVEKVRWDTILCGPGDAGMAATCVDPTCGIVGGQNATGIPTLVSRNGSLCNRLPDWNEMPQTDGYYQYNEEHYTVWLAYAKACSGFSIGHCPNKPIEAMWVAWHGRRLHPTVQYDGHRLLSRWSSYIVQLTFYTMHEFNSDRAYKALFESHWLADKAFYSSTQFYAGDRGRYGLGAGPLPSWCSASCKVGQANCYLADFIAEVPGFTHCRTYSPYSIAGYLPVAPNVITVELLQLLEDGQAVAPVLLDTTTAESDEPLYYVLLRKSLLEPAWNQTEDVTMVDFASELWGLSTIWLGVGFYERNGARWPTSSAD